MGADAFVCTLGAGTQTLAGDYMNAEKYYPLAFAKLAKKLEVPYFGMLTAQFSSPKSFALLFKIKGELEEAIKSLNLKNAYFYQPALLKKRESDFRLDEFLIGLIPFIPGIEANELGKVILYHALEP